MSDINQLISLFVMDSESVKIIGHVNLPSI